MSSDSSEDENINCLREAVDPSFINDGMFDTRKSNKKAKEEKHDKPSLRFNNDEDNQFNMLNVTPQFQDYVAKQLSTILEDYLQKRLCDKSSIPNLQKQKRKAGVKLFTHSTKFIKLHKSNFINGNNQHNKANKIHKEDDSDNELKCSQVAINGNDIINKKDVQSWSGRSKAIVYSYKKSKNSNVLISQESDVNNK